MMDVGFSALGYQTRLAMRVELGILEGPNRYDAVFKENPRDELDAHAGDVRAAGFWRFYDRKRLASCVDDQ
jgi:hypothetical protein